VEVVLVRHAQAEVDPSLPASEWALSAAGVVASARCGQLLVSHGWAGARVVSSDEHKALQTANRISSCTGSEVRHDARLAEVGGRQWLTNGYAQAAADFLSGLEVAGWEQWAAVSVRMHQAFRDWSSDGRCILVSHGLSLSVLVSQLFPDVDAVAFWHGLRFPDAWSIDADGSLSRLSDRQ
jgi:broad specificity phosphatase PhoE